jgi:hypothetical protein
LSLKSFLKSGADIIGLSGDNEAAHQVSPNGTEFIIVDALEDDFREICTASA